MDNRVDVVVWVMFQFRCKCMDNLLGLALGFRGGTHNVGARLTVMRNKKSKWIIG